MYQALMGHLFDGQIPGQFNPRKCPIHGTDMVEQDFHGVIVDTCTTCRGSWLDPTELERIADVAARRLAKQKIDLCGTHDPAGLRWADDFYSQPTPTSPRHCPVDGASMILCHRGGIEIDYCPVCRGIWCDTGELESIIHRVAQRLALQALEMPIGADMAGLALPMRADPGPCAINDSRAREFRQRLKQNYDIAHGPCPDSIQNHENARATKFLLRQSVKLIGFLPIDDNVMLQVLQTALKFWRF